MLLGDAASVRVTAAPCSRVALSAVDSGDSPRYIRCAEGFGGRGVVVNDEFSVRS